jgi:photosystem II stability/assembly factor-like uncharacterized protein
MQILCSKPMTTFFVIFFLLFINHSAVLSQLHWNIQLWPPGFRQQSRVALSNDGKHAITVGRANSYYTSTDSGFSWNKGSIAGLANLTSASYYLGNNILVSNDEGTINRSTNHGNTWQSYVLEKGIPILCTRHIKDSILLATTLNGSIFRSTDAGLNWTSVHSDSLSINEIGIGNNGSILAVGQKGKIIKSKDLGLTWISTLSQAPDSINILRVSFVGDSTWVIAGDTSFIARTDDNGKSWNPIVTDSSKKNRRFNVSTLSFTDEGIGVIVDYDLRNTPTANIFFTWDKGKTWKRGYNVYSDFDAELLQIADIRFFSNSLNGIVAGGNDRIATLRIIKDSLPFSYERVEKVGARTDFYIPAIFYAQASDETYFEAIDSNRILYLREYDTFGKIIKTWKKKDSSLRYKYLHAQKLNEKDAILYIDSMFAASRIESHIHITSDGGISWRSTKPPTKDFFNKGFWLDTFNGLINTFSGVSTFITTDAGFSWDSIQYPSKYENILFQSFSLDSSYYFGFATNKIDKTIDLISLNKAREWRLLLSNIPKGRITAKDNNHFSIFGEKEMYFLSIPPSADTAQLQTIGPVNSWVTKQGKSLWIQNLLLHANNGYDVRYSKDSGINFLDGEDIITDKLKDMFSSVFNLHRPSSFITIGKRVLLSTAPGGIVIISDPINNTTNIQETKSDIYTNPPYPNPFSKSTTISVDWLFTLSVQSLTLKVYNSIGEEVRDVTKDLHAHAQNYRSSLVFDAGNLPDGVYYVVCKGGSHISSQRLIIAR